MMLHKPNDTEAYYNRGIAYYKEHEYDKAITAFSEVIKREPDHAEAYYNRGNVYRDELGFDEVIIDYTKAIELKPDYADAYYQRGSLYVESGRGICPLTSCVS